MNNQINKRRKEIGDFLKVENERELAFVLLISTPIVILLVVAFIGPLMKFQELVHAEVIRNFMKHHLGVYGYIFFEILLGIGVLLLASRFFLHNKKKE